MKKFLILASLIFTSQFANAYECVKIPDNVAQLSEVGPNRNTVTGALAEFDPCNFSVKFTKPTNVEKPPVFVMIHGGGGWGMFESNLADALVDSGFAVLSFDAYKMNKLYRDRQFFVTSMTNEARQRMIYKVALGAVDWVVKNKDMTNGKIYIYGISNGGAVAANLAGAVSNENIQAVFAEGTTSSGLGLPFKVNVPVRILVGKQDNYGGFEEDDYIFTRRTKCFFNVVFTQPEGTAKSCNANSNQMQTGESVSEWVERLRKQAANVDVWYYENSAHGVWAMPLTKTIKQIGPRVLYAYTGGSVDDRVKMLNDIKSFTSK